MSKDLGAAPGECLENDPAHPEWRVASSGSEAMPGGENCQLSVDVVDLGLTHSVNLTLQSYIDTGSIAA